MSEAIYDKYVMVISEEVASYILYTDEALQWADTFREPVSSQNHFCVSYKRRLERLLERFLCSLYGLSVETILFALSFYALRAVLLYNYD